VSVVCLPLQVPAVNDTISHVAPDTLSRCRGLGRVLVAFVFTAPAIVGSQVSFLLNNAVASARRSRSNIRQGVVESCAWVVDCSEQWDRGGGSNAGGMFSWCKGAGCCVFASAGNLSDDFLLALGAGGGWTELRLSTPPLTQTALSRLTRFVAQMTTQISL
jgi:hypothetical protein